MLIQNTTYPIYLSPTSCKCDDTNCELSKTGCDITRQTRQSEGQLYPPLQNDNGAASKFKAQTGGLQL